MMNNSENKNIKNPFRVPDNYFEEANRRIIAATSGQEKKIPGISVYKRFRTAILVAASVTGFLIISYTATKLFNHDKVKNPVSELLNDITTESFINDIDISDLEETVLPVNSELGTEVSESDIIDYLIFENIELSEIYAKL